MLILSISIYYWVRYNRLPVREIRTVCLNSFKTSVLVLPLLFFTSFACAAGKWDLKKDSDGIKIYTSTLASPDVKAIRAELN